MAPKILYDLSLVDSNTVEIPIERIRTFNPQRYEFEQLHGVFTLREELGIIVGYRDIGADEFWVRGHLPGRPIFPGVFMIEAAAQLCSVYQGMVCPPKGFFGFGGVDAVRFRSAVLPGDRLMLLGRAVQVNQRRSTFETQGVVNGRLVFEATIIGVALPANLSAQREGVEGSS